MLAATLTFPDSLIQWNVPHKSCAREASPEITRLKADAEVLGS